MTVERKYKWTTIIACPTFNHAKFITEALDGFVRQKTNFPFVILLFDDNSNDGTQSVIHNYVERNFSMDDEDAYEKDTELYKLFYAKHKENKNCYIAAYFLKVNHYSEPNLREKKVCYYEEWRKNAKYEAICEGDDFWINENKLQIQMDFLDSHAEYSVCTHRVFKYDSEYDIYWADRLSSIFKGGYGVTYANKSRVWLSETSSLVYRLEDAKPFFEYRGIARDNVRMYFLLREKKGMCLKETMSVYRQHSGGVFSKQSTQKRLVDGSYKALKELYSNQRDGDSRYLYYRCYANTFIATRGSILRYEKFDLIKFLSLIFFIPTIIFGIHPVYKKIDNKPW